MHASTNYIYIAFAILYVIYSIIKASKKTTQQKTETIKPEQHPTVQPPVAPPIPQKQPGDDLKKMIEDLLGVPQQNTPPPQPAMDHNTKPEPLKIKPQPAKIVLHEKKERAVPSHIPSKTKETAKPFLTGEKKASPKVLQEVVAEEEQTEDFDIRRAVIYSEILKRPEW